LRAEIIQSSAEDLRGIATESIDFAYSVHTIPYVTDTLSALSSIYRVLAPGGIAYLTASSNDICISPPFKEILSSTPNANTVIKVNDTARKVQGAWFHVGAIKITKHQDVEKLTFPFRLKDVRNNEDHDPENYKWDFLKRYYRRDV
jgi:ubiquinone/menaquinone biosynthesis C-methylase UbiE